MKCLTLCTAGHIDHGKTALLRALTGIDADRLKEEKERGITIDIGFAPWIEPPYMVGLVDLPGHEKLIKNMLAGAGGMDGVLLIVAADEGIMPQTREHFEIAGLLGLKTGLIVLTKVDLADPELLPLVEEEIREMVRGSFLEEVSLVRTSVVTGQGIDELRVHLRRLADETPRREEEDIPQLFVDRSFFIRGFGRVVTGTVRGGRFRRNELVTVLPGDTRCKIRNIQVYDQPVEEALAGQRAALNLAGGDVDGLVRGMVITLPGTLTPSDRFNALFRLLPSFGRTVRSDLPVHLYIGSAELEARLLLVEAERLDPGQEMFAQFRLEESTLVRPGDRFVVRQYSPLVTMGGGVVVESHPARFRRREAAGLVSRLARLMTADNPGRVLLLLDESPTGGLTVGKLQDATGFGREKLLRILGTLRAEGRVLPSDAACGFWMRRERVESLRAQLLAALQENLRVRPFSPSIRKDELRSTLPAIAPEVFAFLLDDAEARTEMIREGDRWTRPGRREEVCLLARPVWDTHGRDLLQAGLEGWDRETLRSALAAAAPHEESMLELLLVDSQVIKADDDYYLSPVALSGARLELVRRFPSPAEFDVPAAKEVLGLTRRRAIPLLEYFDREGFTIRIGNGRRVR